MNQCQAETNHCAGLSFSWGFLTGLDSRRDGRVELGVSILQSAKCWNVTQAKQEERICLRLCDIYVCRKLVNVRLLLDINDLVAIS